MSVTLTTSTSLQPRPVIDRRRTVSASTGAALRPHRPRPRRRPVRPRREAATNTQAVRSWGAAPRPARCVRPIVARPPPSSISRWCSRDVAEALVRVPAQTAAQQSANRSRHWRGQAVPGWFHGHDGRAHIEVMVSLQTPAHPSAARRAVPRRPTSPSACPLAARAPARGTCSSRSPGSLPPGCPCAPVSATATDPPKSQRPCPRIKRPWPGSRGPSLAVSPPRRWRASRSRWTIPSSWAATRASAICLATSSAHVSAGHPSALQPLREILTLGRAPWPGKWTAETGSALRIAAVDVGDARVVDRARQQPGFPARSPARRGHRPPPRRAAP